MICLKLNFFYSLSSMLQFSQFVWPLSYSVWDVFNNFLLIDATDRSKISIDQKRFFIALSLYPLSFFANTPFNKKLNIKYELLNLLKSTWLRIAKWKIYLRSRCLLSPFRDYIKDTKLFILILQKNYFTMVACTYIFKLIKKKSISLRIHFFLFSFQMLNANSKKK